MRQSDFKRNGWKSEKFCFRIEKRLSFHCESVQDYKENVTDSNINPNRYALNTSKEGAKENQIKTVLP